MVWLRCLNGQMQMDEEVKETVGTPAEEVAETVEQPAETVEAPAETQ